MWERVNKGNIVLIGFMGSGKTTVGIRLSYKWKRPFLDTDKLIECREGRTISEIFAAEGEEYFRALETEEVRALGEGLIVSTGGGLVLREENVALLKERGLAPTIICESDGTQAEDAAAMARCNAALPAPATV